MLKLNRLDLDRVPTPCFVCDLAGLRQNLEILGAAQRLAGCKILLALKGFAMWSVFPLVRRYLHGVAASSVDEARLGREEFAREVHVYSPAYSESSLSEVLEYADHVVFNSLSQWQRLRPLLERSGRAIECGIRINPEHSEVDVPLYDPCAPHSRLGATERAMRGADLSGISGLHFHVLCQSGSDALERTLAAVERKFGTFLSHLSWVNFGGGHHITRPDYDIDRLVRIIQSFKERYSVDVYLEPGEAIALNAGYLVVSVLDVLQNEMPIAMLDTSASAHMPDVIEMPYRPEIVGAGPPHAYPYSYRLGGLTCLAGDIVGDYSFPRPLEVGDKLIFSDMAHYTMVKNTTFNGVRLPSIATYDPETDEFVVVRRFDYSDYRSRLS